MDACDLFLQRLVLLKKCVSHFLCFAMILQKSSLDFYLLPLPLIVLDLCKFTHDLLPQILFHPRIPDYLFQNLLVVLSFRITSPVTAFLSLHFLPAI